MSPRSGASRLRILVVAPNVRIPGIHGGAAHVAGASRALAHHHDVLVLARRGSRIPDGSGARVAAVGLGTAPGALAAGLRGLHLAVSLPRARSFRPDVVYERNSAQGLGARLGVALRVPVVTAAIDPDVDVQSARHSVRFVATDLRLVPPARIQDARLVRWGVDVERFHPDLRGGDVRRELRLDGASFVVVYAGAFYPWHDLPTLLRAADLAARRVPRLALVLVGSGRCSRSVAREARRGRLRSLCRIVGSVPHDLVPRYLAAADVCVAPYDPRLHPRHAGLGMIYEPIKVLEGLAAGRPVVTLDAPNLRRTFADGEELLLTPAGDADALASRLVLLAEDRALARRLGAAGRARVCGSMTWEHHAGQLDDVLREAIDASAAARGLTACADPDRRGRGASRRRFPWQGVPGSASD